MKHFVHRIFLGVLAILGTAFCYGKAEDYDFYIKVGSGISVSESAHVVAFYPPWNAASQGYETSLGNCPIAALSIGCELFHVIDLEVSVANRSMFKYNKFQTSLTDGQSYTREFDLSVTPILFSANILGRGIPHLHHDFSSGSIYPILGAGLGVSNLLMTNYRTIDLPATGSSAPYQSFSAENQYTLRQNFTYTLSAGVEYSHEDRWAIGTGYRWFNAGNLNGPEYLRTADGSAVDVAHDQWQMRFRAKEWFIEFKIFI